MPHEENLFLDFGDRAGFPAGPRLVAGRRRPVPGRKDQDLPRSYPVVVRDRPLLFFLRPERRPPGPSRSSAATVRAAVHRRRHLYFEPEAGLDGLAEGQVIDPGARVQGRPADRRYSDALASGAAGPGSFAFEATGSWPRSKNPAARLTTGNYPVRLPEKRRRHWAGTPGYEGALPGERRSDRPDRSFSATNTPSSASGQLGPDRHRPEAGLEARPADDRLRPEGDKASPAGPRQCRRHRRSGRRRPRSKSCRAKDAIRTGTISSKSNRPQLAGTGAVVASLPGVFQAPRIERRGRSSVVERLLAMQKVVGSSPIARSNVPCPASEMI